MQHGCFDGVICRFCWCSVMHNGDRVFFSSFIVGCGKRKMRGPKRKTRGPKRRHRVDHQVCGFFL